MIEVEVNGVIHEFPEGTSQEVIRTALQKKYSIQPTNEQQPTPSGYRAGDLGYNLSRTLGRAGRNVAAAAGGAADLIQLPLKTLASAGEFGLEKTGFEGSPIEKTLQAYRTLPGTRESALQVIDQSTGGMLQPQGTMEKGFDLASEMLVPIDPMAKVAQATGMLKQVPAVVSAPTRTAADVKTVAGSLYKQANQSGGMLKPQVTDDFVDEAIKSVAPQTSMGKAIAGKDDKITQLLDNLQSIKGQPMTLEAAQEIDELLGDLADAATENGRVTKQALKFIKVQNTLRNKIEGANPNDVLNPDGFDALKAARKEWSRSRKLDDLERVVYRAEMTDNPSTSIKTGIRGILTNETKAKAFTKDEREALKSAVKTGIVPEMMRLGASRLNPIIAMSSGAGGMTGTATAAGAGMLSRSLLDQYYLDQLNAVQRQIAGQGPAVNLKAVNQPLRAGILGSGAIQLNQMLGGQ